MYSNNQSQYDKVVSFRDAAIADGWTVRENYPSSSGIENLEKSGFKMMVVLRQNIGKWKFEAEISIWGPDGLSIKLSETYSMESIVAGLLTCNECGKTGVETERYSFAGRCCKECLPAMQKKHEYSGWTN
jgi:hypothetical protein